MHFERSEAVRNRRFVQVLFHALAQYGTYIKQLMIARSQLFSPEMGSDSCFHFFDGSFVSSRCQAAADVKIVVT